jgi:hypothetical protein
MTPTRYRFLILGKAWELRVMKRRKYMRKNGRDSLAITTFHKRRIDLSPFGQDEETIVHELVHAYLYELCQPPPHSVTIDELEETYCELMAKFGGQLLALGSDLFERISKSQLTADEDSSIVD